MTLSQIAAFALKAMLLWAPFIGWLFYYGRKK